MQLYDTAHFLTHHWLRGVNRRFQPPTKNPAEYRIMTGFIYKTVLTIT